MRFGSQDVATEVAKEVANGSPLLASLPIIGGGLLAVAALTAFAVPFAAKSNPYAGGTVAYDPVKADAFYGQRPWLLIGRLVKIILLAASFNINLLLDWRFGNLEKNEKDRAKQALGVLGGLGPTFVKLGQALSIRTDLIPAAYADELKKLQDAVPPFDSAQAKAIVCRELGITDLSQRFRSFSDKPVAAASIGQVYKATLLDGREVAVKVQRPDILDEICLDLHLLRMVAPLQVRLTGLVNGEGADEKDMALGYGLVDEWGRGLVGEVDYRQEASNTKQFIEAMSKRGLNAVTSPMVVSELSRDRILVTEWITGTRLDRDSSADVPRLCGLAVNAYLTMLLDTGVLHCDPHPGNLLRTTDGRLCILDWGMTLALPKDLQYGLLEFISHINADDFDSLPLDFVKLGATPPDKVEEVRKAGIANGFKVIMKQLSKGGGPSKLTDGLRVEFQERYGTNLSDMELTQKAAEEMINTRKVNNNINSNAAGADELSMDVSGVAGIMEMISKRNRDIFQLPTYMLYVVRAFSTLEGIGLSINPAYSILQECYPYLAKRLMTDDSPRSRAALRNMMYRDGRLKTDKLVEFSQGFTDYTASTADADSSGRGQAKAQDALADLLLDRDGNLMQELLVEGAAKFVDSAVRVGVNRLKSSPGGKLAGFALKAPKALVDMFVPNELKPVLLPLTLPHTLPYDISKAVMNLVQQDENDAANVQSLKVLYNSFEPKLRSQISGLVREALVSSDDNSDGKAERDILLPLSLIDSKAIRQALGRSKMNERIPVVLRLSRKLGANIFSQAASRFEAAARSSAETGSSNHRGPHTAAGAYYSEQKSDFYYEEDDIDFEVNHSIIYIRLFHYLHFPHSIRSNYWSQSNWARCPQPWARLSPRCWTPTILAAVGERAAPATATGTAAITGGN